jgi:hypothetical protein
LEMRALKKWACCLPMCSFAIDSGLEIILGSVSLYRSLPFEVPNLCCALQSSHSLGPTLSPLPANRLQGCRSPRSR